MYRNFAMRKDMKVICIFCEFAHTVNDPVMDVGIHLASNHSCIVKS